MERLRHLSSIQDDVTAERNAEWLDREALVLVDQIEDGVPVGRTYRQAPEIDGIVRLDGGSPGEWLTARFTGVHGHDMEAVVS